MSENKSKYKHEFILKQHTPIIHFKGKENGATLRETDLKSYITKFIKNELLVIDRQLYDEYHTLINNENIFPEDSGSNVYSLNIIQRGTKDFKNNDGTKKLGSYFGENPSVMYDNDLIIKIFSRIKGVALFIKKILLYVTTYYSFGTRRNKGFGSYFKKDISQENIENILLLKYPILFKFTANQPLKSIKDKYMLIKGGINYRDRQQTKHYKKSEFFKFFCKNNIRWEKRKIKQTIQSEFPEIFNTFSYDFNDAESNRILDCEIENEPLNFKFIRALLGLAELFSYTTNDRNIKYIVSVSDTLNQIQRFKSPISFKVYENTVYVLPEEIPTIMFDRNFTFDLKKKNGENPAQLVNDGEGFMTIDTPEQVGEENIIVSFLRTQNFTEVTS